ncbi:hypothetical protein [Paenibacillus sp. 1P07SE]|uniref:hypothetical protein n=1 Tax=Paenibacillus sp. 1P07SE TaxID=3132209 RepID=UPI0039A43EB6
MTTKLIHDALRLLRDQLDPGVEMIFTPDAVEIEDIATLLQTHTLDYNRKVTILACCILIRLAVLKHLQLTLEDNALLTRSILDGDYLSGLLYRLASKRREWRLLLNGSPRCRNGCSSRCCGAGQPMRCSPNTGDTSPII